jgi:hypothetical protein
MKQYLLSVLARTDSRDQALAAAAIAYHKRNL